MTNIDNHPNLDRLLFILSNAIKPSGSVEQDVSAAFDASALNNDLIQLLIATGVMITSEEEQIWSDFEAAEQGSPTASAETFRTIARDRNDPLSTARASDSLIQSRINNALRGWWERYRRSASLTQLPEKIVDVRWVDLRDPSTSKQSEAQRQIRLRIKRLANNDEPRIRLGRPFKNVEQTLLVSVVRIIGPAEFV